MTISISEIDTEYKKKVQQIYWGREGCWTCCYNKNTISKMSQAGKLENTNEMGCH